MSSSSLRKCALALLGVVACATPRDHAVMRVDLEHAQALVTRGDLPAAAKLLERSLAPADDDGAKLQRFHAAVLLVRTHVAAAFGAPFLGSGLPPEGAEWRLDARARTQSASPLAHCVAALRWADYARGWYDEVQGIAPNAGGETLLPEALGGVTTRDTLAYVHLAALACFARLRFEDRVEEILAGIPELTELERCDTLLAATRVEDGARPWIYVGVFEHVVRTDEPLAFKFAVHALETSTGAHELGEREHERLANWITRDSHFVFKCPTCKTLADPVLFSCSVCRRPTLEFEPEPRETSK
ncbi:MAG: hypothetical protein K8S98_08415 [Planctomycetes bacterium]|nr:hypothetical protein [Planctomycetota bacterium]